jgi:hypothetical protein
LEGAFVLFFMEEGVHEREGCVHLVYMDMNLFLRMNNAMDVGDLMQAWYGRWARCSAPPYMEAINLTDPWNYLAQLSWVV